MKYGFARMRLLLGPGKDLIAVNHVIEAMLLPESEGKGLYVVDLRTLSDEKALKYLLDELEAMQNPP